MTALKLLAAASLSLLVASQASAQQMPQGAPPSAEQQVSQLDELIGLEEGQQQELVALLNDSQAIIEQKQSEAEQVQAQLYERVQPDVDEAAIREDAQRLGQLTGDMAAESVLMQARIQSTLTQEQRDELERQMEQQREQMRQMQEQMQQQQPAQ
ncbi:hypothetical protein [Halomonas urumqiensis]|uniref:Zinc resistance-associated protein n=1 Tax=Halomonas urumqiensis TaxID=1684789 RepID=A0A2N7UPS1_9GAMM|nr:hypothetical protein [Halomonas urumqiensis]PMR82437.1 hypothetical protein C1H70_01585 [Halomonas urumqiensis]PTB04082.1 hypothetical protein C6V82_06415 [Halomonas urumqiensis]GHE19654.1 hypothetical protein GCM10017767_01750 [Halomonas urumqiensis]